MREFDLPPTICPPPLLEFHKQFPLEPLGPYNKCDVRALRFALGHWVRWGRGGGIMGSVRASLIVRMNTRNIIVESCNSFEIHELAHGCSNGD